MLRVAGALCLLVGFGLAGAGARAAQPPEPAAVVLKPGDEAPAFLLKTMNEAQCGQQVLASKKVFGPRVAAPRALVLSFGASYCKPCRAELPHFKALAERYADRPVLFAVVVRDEDDAGIEAMRKLTVDELALRFPVLSDRFSLLARRYGAEELPYLVVIGAEGRVAWVQSGFHDDTMTRLAATLDRVLTVPEPGVPAP